MALACHPLPTGRRTTRSGTVPAAPGELAGRPTRDLHARLGSGHDDHAQGNALVQVPLLHGRRHADDTHQQQRGVLEVLRCHLREASSVTSPPRPAQGPAPAGSMGRSHR